MTQTATFAAGCFWGVEERFRKLPGVEDAEVGYTGGRTPDPSYEAVCTGTTGHAEAVRVTFDPQVIPYEQLVTAFFALHDPTTRDRQGPDVGRQYRSAIFAESPEQEQTARAVLERLQAQRDDHRQIVTEIAPATDFFRAEDYHQRYNEKHGRASCAL
ncbi:MAG: peptide-methionine (S)-S-oxide reductase MsrA [Thermoleophilia bacterium]|jgi:methionine-S-sulfoxide reductase